MLIDAWREVGLEAIAQVDLDEHRNPHKPLPSARADGADGACDDRCGCRAAADGRASAPGRCAGPRARSSARPLVSVWPAAAPTCAALYLDLDGTLLGRGALAAARRRGHA